MDVPVFSSPDEHGSSGYLHAREHLTDAQLRAVDTPARALCIVAGAGTGKTRVLTLRVARRILDGTAEADHTIVCTFTRKAADELRHRLTHYGVAVSQPAGPGGVPTAGVRAGTLHQLALALLRKHAADAGRPPPDVSDRRWRDLVTLTGDRSTAGSIDTEIGWAKARGLDPGEYTAAVAAASRSVDVPVASVAETFAAYQELLHRRRQIDLDDLLLDAASLIESDLGFAQQIHWRYRHLSVDEFQDVNPAQFRLIQAIAGEAGDVCTVGDPNQSIYGWNGADPSLLHTLPSLMPGLEVVRLESNHRCTPQVVAAAVAALGPAQVAPPTSAVADGPLPTLTAYPDSQAEADGVAQRLSARAAAGTKWSDQAVLARTHDQLATIRQALDRHGIPCRFAPAAEEIELEPPQTGGAGAARLRPRAPAQETSGAAEPDGWVELATFHRAKGLEWPTVFVVGLEDGYVPIVHATTPDAIAEERRLLYVALTRAAVDLDCSWAQHRIMKSGRSMERQASPWLADLDVATRAGDSLGPTPASADRFADLRAALGR